jgi:uncharacterized protein YukE
MGFVVDAAKKALLRVARAVLDNTIIPGISKVLGSVLDEVLSPAKTIVGTVSGGEAWRGIGADAFVEQVSSEVIPKMQQVVDHVESLSKNIQFARDTIDRADEDAERLIRSRLCDQFNFYQ